MPPTTQVVANALSTTAAPQSVYELAAVAEVPLGVALVGVHELAAAGLVCVSPTISPGTAQARTVAPRLWSLRAPAEFPPATISARIAVAGRWAEALVHAVGGHVRVLRSRMPHRERAMRTVCLSAGNDAAVHVVAETTTGHAELWHDLVRGALGVVVTADRAYADHAEETIAACRDQGIAHVVAVLDDGHPPIELLGWARATLPIDDATPVGVLTLGDRTSALLALAMLEKPCLPAERSATNDSVTVLQDGGQ